MPRSQATAGDVRAEGQRCYAGVMRNPQPKAKGCANRRARQFVELSAEEGDVVTVAMPNGIEFCGTMFAVWKLGATPKISRCWKIQTSRGATGRPEFDLGAVEIWNAERKKLR